MKQGIRIHDSGPWRQVVIDGGKGAHTYLPLGSRRYQRGGARIKQFLGTDRIKSHRTAINFFLRTLQYSSNFQPFPLKPWSPLEYLEAPSWRAPTLLLLGSIPPSIQTKIIFPGNSCNRRRAEQFRQYFRSLIHRQIEVRPVSLPGDRTEFLEKRKLVVPSSAEETIRRVDAAPRMCKRSFHKVFPILLYPFFFILSIYSFYDLSDNYIESRMWYNIRTLHIILPKLFKFNLR